MLLPLKVEGGRGCESWYPLFYLTFTVAFLLEHNVDEKIMRNIEVRIHVKLEVIVNQDFFKKRPLPPLSPPLPRKNLDPCKKIWPIEKTLTHLNNVKIMIHAKKI